MLGEMREVFFEMGQDSILHMDQNAFYNNIATKNFVLKILFTFSLTPSFLSFNISCDLFLKKREERRKEAQKNSL